jgi:hypothetical protein
VYVYVNVHVFNLSGVRVMIRAVSYNRWGAEALVNLAIQTEIGAQDPAGRVGRGIRALGYNPDNFSLDFGMLFLVGVMWRVFTFLRLKYRKNTV